MSDGLLRCCRQAAAMIPDPVEGQIGDCVECGAFFKFRDGRWRWLDLSWQQIQKEMRDGARLREAEIPHLRKDADAKHQ